MQDRVIPDCMNCWKREACSMAEEGFFCGAWQSKQPEPKGTDPNDAWEKGESPWDQQT